MENDILRVALCIIPSLILMIYIYVNDKIEKEPVYLLTFLFIGGIISAILSSIISSNLKIIFPFLNTNYSNMSILQIIIKSLLLIALVEEVLKWIINFLATWKNKNFNHIYDPIVYSTFLSLGFATYENILYGYIYNSIGLNLIVLRGIISVPCHAVFGIYMGYYLGIAKNAFKKTKHIKYIFKSLLIPILLHFLYDLLLITENNLSNTIFIIYVIIIYILAYRITKKFNTQKKLLKKED